MSNIFITLHINITLKYGYLLDVCINTVHFLMFAKWTKLYNI